MRFLFSILFLFIGITCFSQSWKPANGSTDKRDHYTAFTNATIFVKEGKILSNATLLIKENKIVEVGTNVSIPANSLVKNLEGQFIYPSFIDLYTQFGIDSLKATSSGSRKPQLESKKAGSYFWNESVKAENRAVKQFSYSKKHAEQFRKMGFGSLLSHQMDGIIRGTSALVSLTDEEVEQVLLPDAAMQYSFYKGVSKQTYPTSLMGMMALIRQAHHDAKWYAANQATIEYNQTLAALNQQKELPKIIEVGSLLSIFRADTIGDEFDFQFIIKGSGQEYERIEAIKATAAPLIVPIDYPKAYDVSDAYDALRLPLSKMKEWEMAPHNLSVLHKNNIEFAITSAGLKSPEDLFKNLQKSVEKGLSRSAAIRALTETPAKLINQSGQLGTLEAGKVANFIITSDSLFSKECQLNANWNQGSEFVITQESAINYEGNYSLNINKKLQFLVKVEQKNKKWLATVKAKDENIFQKASLKLANNRLSLSFENQDKSYQLSGSVNDSLSRIWSGKTMLNGEWVDWAAIKMSTSSLEAMEDSEEKTDSSFEAPIVWYPNMAYGFDSLPTTPKTIVFRNATLWTNEEEGILKNQDLVIHDGEIKMLGYKINMEVMFPDLVDKAIEIDASGKHITCGIIDEHSHIAIDRGVNESGQAITAEVSIQDVVKSNDINIYRQLAGGVTTSQLLHGSANPSGGQSAIIKLRWGFLPQDMLVEDAAGFIKFALGENVKQSNWGDHRTVRFPQTRMGVEQVFYDGFYRARAYQDEWKIYNSKSRREKEKKASPRVDLELEALSEILDSTRFITCHSYLQSEMNMLMHVADSMQFQLNTFTHALEAYKIAYKLRENGVAASTFSDWWAYKFEVNDAIPYNGAILHNCGVLTAFNSDDAEMGRRLNQEAAKAVKYGGVSEEEAWKFVTLNPAKMLHLDHRMGSLKPGKDADIVVWSAHPLSIYTKAEQTYIDGMLFYDQTRDNLLQKRILEERERLISLMLNEKATGKDTQKVKEENQLLYECETIEQ